jgi:CRISPR/Cas system-associated protein endoribonuclease Cas2
VTYYEGTDGLLSVYEDILKVKEPYEMLLFSKADEFASFLPRDFMQNIMKKKVQTGITTRALFPNTESNKNFNETYFKNVPERFQIKCKYIDEDKFALSGEIIIYGDSKISIINLNKNQLMAVIIEDKSLHNMLRTIFELSWNSTLVK